MSATDSATAEALPSHILQQEYELVRNAFYTEPHDQSSWLYLRWLIGNSLASWQRAKGSPAEPAATQAASTLPLLSPAYKLHMQTSCSRCWCLGA